MTAVSDQFYIKVREGDLVCSSCFQYKAREGERTCLCELRATDPVKCFEYEKECAAFREMQIQKLIEFGEKVDLSFSIVTLEQRIDLTVEERDLLYRRNPKRVCFCDAFDCNCPTTFYEDGRNEQWMGCYCTAVGFNFKYGIYEDIETPEKLADKPYTGTILHKYYHGINVSEVSTIEE